MNHLIRLPVLFALFALLAACASPGASAPAPEPLTVARAPEPTLSARWPSESFYVRPLGARGPLVAYDTLDGQRSFELPAGLLSADGQSYFAATPLGEDTQLSRYDLGAGEAEPRARLSGRWMLSGISPTGAWLAVTRLPGEDEQAQWTSANTWRTDLQILEADDGQAVHQLSLDGNFEVETISADGKSLFLVQHLPAVTPDGLTRLRGQAQGANPDHYLIRLYDLSKESLVADPLRAKGSDEVMAGWAWEGLGTPDGKWLLTLYLSTRRNVAFVHTLDLIQQFPVCIDLPSGSGDFARLKNYTLTLSRDGQRVYAANATLGVVAELDLSSRQITHKTFFVGRVKNDPGMDYTAHSVLSRDGGQLFFTDGHDAWAYDTRAREVSGPYSIEGPIHGLGLSRDGRWLFVATAQRPLRVFDVATQQELSLETGEPMGR
jgi:hypothetical protein